MPKTILSLDIPFTADQFREHFDRVNQIRRLTGSEPLWPDTQKTNTGGVFAYFLVEDPYHANIPRVLELVSEIDPVIAQKARNEYLVYLLDQIGEVAKADLSPAIPAALPE